MDKKTREVWGGEAKEKENGRRYGGSSQKFAGTSQHTVHHVTVNIPHRCHSSGKQNSSIPDHTNMELIVSISGAKGTSHGSAYASMVLAPMHKPTMTVNPLSS